MSYEILFDPRVRESDFHGLPRNLRDRILAAIAERLTSHPDQYGDRLRKSLSGFWKLRVGDYRIIYRIEGRRVIVLLVAHRKDAYLAAAKRLLR